MYLEKWWWPYFNDTEDSKRLVGYFAKMASVDYSLQGIFADLGLDKAIAENNMKSDGGLRVQYQKNDIPYHVTFDLAIDVVLDLAIITLECLTEGRVDIQTLDPSRARQHITMNVAKPELSLLCQALEDFKAAPETYEIAGQIPHAKLDELTAIAGELAVLLRRFT